MALRRIGKKITRTTHKLARKRSQATRPPGELVIITGMSGSGKASALKAFEISATTVSIICRWG